MGRVTFTVAICTWNRAALIGQALEQLTRLQTPRGGWELIVVNNNSTDGTEGVLNAFMDRLPLRRFFEPTPGLSYARNTAVRNALGDYLVWTDDDVLVDRDWLVAYQDAVERWPNAVIFGGPVTPKFEGEISPWLSAAWQDVGDAFAARDFGAEPFQIDGRNGLPYGPNFVVRTHEQKAFLYDPNLGRKEKGGLLSEETTVIQAILASGCSGWWVPDAKVEHWIPKERQTIRYLRNYYKLVGRTLYPWDHYGAPIICGRPPSIWRRLFKSELAYLWGRLSGNPHRWLKPLVKASVLRGAISKPPLVEHSH